MKTQQRINHTAQGGNEGGSQGYENFSKAESEYINLLWVSPCSRTLLNLEVKQFLANDNTAVTHTIIQYG